MCVWSFLYGLKWPNEYYLNNLPEKSSREEKLFSLLKFEYSRIDVSINIQPQLNSINHLIIVKPTRRRYNFKSIFENIYLIVITPNTKMSNLTTTSHNFLLLLTFFQINHPHN